MDIEKLVEICKGYSALQTDQLDSLISGRFTLDDLNENAVEEIADWLHSVRAEVDDMVLINGIDTILDTISEIDYNEVDE